MLQFQPITVEAIRRFVPYLSGYNGRLCDFTPTNLYVWKEYYYEAFAESDGLLYFRLCGENGETYYSVPMGNGDREEGLRTLRCHAAMCGEPLRLSLVSDDMRDLISRVFGEVTFHSERMWCDYLYDAQSMAGFVGARYAKQRNHVRRFEREYPSFHVERLQQKHWPVIDRFLDGFIELRRKDSALADEEIERTRRALRRMAELDLCGIVLFVDDRFVGFSAGTKIGDTLYVNFEKADTAYHGIYQKLVQIFASCFVDDTVRYINREEDCGDEGLRKSKLAYHPIALLEKYTVIIPHSTKG